MKVTYFNSNPNVKFFKSGQPKNWYIDDSPIRAISKVLNKSWHQAYDMLCIEGKRLGDIPISKNVINEVLTKQGFKFITYGKPKHGESRLTVEQFIKENNKGTYVLNLASYFVTLIDGQLYDVNDKCLKNSVYSYWLYEP